MSKRGGPNRSDVFSSLLGEVTELYDDGAEQRNLPLSQIVFNPKQPRRYLDESALAALTDSIRQHGVLEPILVRRVGERFEVVAGERRTRAARAANLHSIRAVILNLDETQALEVAVIENLQREDLNPVEETDAVLTLLSVRLEKPVEDVLETVKSMYDESRGRVGNNVISNAEKEKVTTIFASLGRFTPASFHTNRVPLLGLPTELIQAVREGKLHYTKARKLARVQNHGARNLLLERALSEGMTINELDQAIKESLQLRTQDNDAWEMVRSLRGQLSAARIAKLSVEDQRKASKLIEELSGLLK